MRNSGALPQSLRKRQRGFYRGGEGGKEEQGTHRERLDVAKRKDKSRKRKRRKHGKEKEQGPEAAHSQRLTISWWA